MKKTDNIDALLADFTERARHIHSEWIFKPSQEPGTLPILSQTKSLVDRDCQIKRKAGLVQLSDSQRFRLQEVLFKILDENCKLAKLTDSFSTEQGSTAPSTTTTSFPRKTIVARKQETFVKSGRRIVKATETVTHEKITLGSEEPHLKDPMTKSTKRTLGSPDGVSLIFKPATMCTYSWSQQNKRQQRQQTLSQVWRREPVPLCPQPQDIGPIISNQTSFETAPSPAVPSIFSTPEEENDIGGPGSNATSMISSQTQESQDLFPTQDANEYFEDVSFRQSFRESCTSVDEFDPTDLVRNSPFKSRAMLPPNLPFWYCWEVHRVAPSLGSLPIELHQCMVSKYKKLDFSYEEFWTGVRGICSEKKITTVPQRSTLPSWALAENRYEDKETNKVVYFTAALDWEEDPSRGLFKFRLNQIQVEQSSRFNRKFGGDRFLVIVASVFSDSDYPEKVRRLDSDKETTLYQKITRFIATHTHTIAGRWWRFWNVEEVKPKSRTKKQQQQQEPRRIKITMFAQSGYGIADPRTELKDLDVGVARFYPEITIEELIQWHIPIDDNINSTDLKLFSRIGLGFSKTKPTVELLPHEFLYRRDPPIGEVMDDGCALMSFPLAKAIWASYGGSGEVPSVVQGRIAGGKGLWIVDYEGRFRDVSERGYWIQVSDSQLKIKPHPRDRHDADSSQRTFEVLKYWSDCKEGHLNMQLVTILEDRGIPRSVLGQALESDLTDFSDSLSNAMRDPVALRQWMQEHGYNSRSGGNKILGSFPDSKKSQMKVLLESGFHPRDCDKLWSAATDLLKDHMSDYLDKMKIRVPHSTVVFCAPDPCNVLEENEVFLSFSKPITDPATGFSETALDDTDILLARNPAYLASDMQLRRAVYKRELRHYKDVILFSTRGEKPTAALLSGGDYDGDTVTCIWDPQFVEPFQNVEMPKMDSQEECGLVDISRPLISIFKPERSFSDATQDFLCGCLAFNARPNPLGKCSTEHERLVYNLSHQQQSGKLSHRGTITLAALAGYLVDSNKQGWHLADEAWYTLRRNASGPKRLPDPAYKEDDYARAAANNYRNILDLLKFNVAARLSEKAKTAFAEQKSGVAPYDRDLSYYWRDAESQMDQEKELLRALGPANDSLLPHSPKSARLSDLLKGHNGLQGQIHDLKGLWDSHASPADISSSGGETPDNKRYQMRIQRVYEAYGAIEPRKIDHELRRHYEQEVRRNYPFSYWSLLKASCLYSSARLSGVLPDWAWFVAGKELCILKALHHKGDIKVMTAQMHELNESRHEVHQKLARERVRRSSRRGGFDRRRR
ncbi:hypothetical protein H2200_010949 [Cladophialophora chaetospira]|uniref:RNA-dependent RNA polymerase n=1 Tax=Cladophialophora chaetospira TaxID=386627 RepID=A0AA39CE29_9EURO|nr:hypothetical protein H2200_010949 [Cladophialophora chaetospira]